MKQKRTRIPRETMEKIKKEYITTTIGLRELARKYKVSASNLSVRAKKEGWDKVVDQISEKTEQKTIERISDRRAANNEKAMDILTEMLKKVEESLKSVNKKDIGALKSLVQAMKDLGEMGVFQIETAPNEIKVILSEEGNNYAE